MTDPVIDGLAQRRARFAHDIEETHELLRKMVIDLERRESRVRRASCPVLVVRTGEKPTG